MTMLAVWLERRIGLVRAWMPPALGTACGMACAVLTHGARPGRRMPPPCRSRCWTPWQTRGACRGVSGSAQARRQVRPLAALEMAQQKQFVPEVLVVPVGSECGFPTGGAPPCVFVLTSQKFELKLYAKHTGQPPCIYHVRSVTYC